MPSAVSVVVPNQKQYQYQHQFVLLLFLATYFIITTVVVATAATTTTTTTTTISTITTSNIIFKSGLLSGRRSSLTTSSSLAFSHLCSPRRSLWSITATTSSSSVGGGVDIAAAASSSVHQRHRHHRHHRHHHYYRIPSLTKRMMSSSSSSTKNNNNNNSSRRRVALLQFPVTESKYENQQTALKYISKAVIDHGANMIVLPEVWNGPYATSAFPHYAEVLPTVGTTLDTWTNTNNNNKKNDDEGEEEGEESSSSLLLMKAAAEHQIYIVGGSISETETNNNNNNKNQNNKNNIYNTCLIINPNGTIIAKHRKVHLFDIDIPNGITFKESDTLSSGNTFTYFDTGDCMFGTVGVGICYDIRFPEYAQLLCQKYQCNLLIYPGAFNMTTGPSHWELLQRSRALDNQCFVLTVSPARTPPPDDNDDKKKKKYPHYTAWGHSSIIGPWGNVIATCNEHPNIVIGDLDMEKVYEVRNGIPIRQQKRNDLYSIVLKEEKEKE